MIQMGTILNIIDNSGIKKIKCIKILNKKNQIGKIGNIIKCCVIKYKKNTTINKKYKIKHALITQTKKYIDLKNGIKINFNKNTAIILNENLVPIGTRINAIIPKIIKNIIQNYIKDIYNTTI